MTTTVETHDEQQRRTRRRWPLALGAVALLGIGTASVSASAHADPARVSDLYLRNPAVLRSAHVRVQIAEWASAHHLTGLSPASLRPASEATYTPSRFGPR